MSQAVQGDLWQLFFMGLIISLDSMLKSSVWGVYAHGGTVFLDEENIMVRISLPKAGHVCFILCTFFLEFMQEIHAYLWDLDDPIGSRGLSFL